jgi:hypothetical protein
MATEGRCHWLALREPPVPGPAVSNCSTQGVDLPRAFTVVAVL